MTPFQAAIQWQANENGSWTGALPPTWMQGRTAFGGLLTAGAVSILRELVDDQLILRSVETSYLKPITGKFRAEATILSAGRSVCHAQVDFFKDEILTTRVHTIFGKERASSISLKAAPLNYPIDVNSLQDWKFIPGITPAYTQYFQYRMSGGQMPFSGAAKGEIEAYARHREDDHGYPAITALMDAMPPPALTMITTPANASTIRWNCQFIGEPTAPANSWYYYTGTVRTAESGYTHSDGYLYSDNRLIARMEQMIAIFDQ